MWSKTTALGTATGMVSPPTVPLLMVRAEGGQNNCVARLRSGRLLAWGYKCMLGAPTEEKNQPGRAAVPWEGRDWAMCGAADVGTRGWIRSREGQSHRSILPEIVPPHFSAFLFWEEELGAKECEG